MLSSLCITTKSPRISRQGQSFMEIQLAKRPLREISPLHLFSILAQESKNPSKIVAVLSHRWRPHQRHHQLQTACLRDPSNGCSNQIALPHRGLLSWLPQPFPQKERELAS
mmetsp:Transcript_21467/g.42168  ORF Transcript_21467/g.42168 Transcript_21467/m.42168 type:complete len:111 (+) Transcript_21467:375-707(+)